MAEKDWVQEQLNEHKCCFGDGDCKLWADRLLRVGDCNSRFCDTHLLATLKELPVDEQLEQITRMANAYAENAAKAREAR